MPSSEHTTPPQTQQNTPAPAGAKKQPKGDRRRSFVAPRLECHDELPIITAGSICWEFEEGD